MRPIHWSVGPVSAHADTCLPTCDPHLETLTFIPPVSLPPALLLSLLCSQAPVTPQGVLGSSGLGTYVAERTIATQGPWLVIFILLGILLTCGDRRATVTPAGQLCLPPPTPTRSQVIYL